MSSPFDQKTNIAAIEDARAERHLVGGTDDRR
jgi:hypothetical protein